MNVVQELKSRGTRLAGNALNWVFADERRAQKVGELLTLVQKGRAAVDAAQENALRTVGVASSGSVKDAGRRLAALRRSARKLDEKLDAVASRLEGDDRASA